MQGSSLDDENQSVDLIGVIDADKKWTTEQLITAQKWDGRTYVTYKLILGKKCAQNCKNPELNTYFICDDVLFYRKTINKPGGKDDHINIVVSTSWEEGVISLAHESPGNGHMAKDRTQFKLNLQYHCLNDVSIWLRVLLETAPYAVNLKLKKH